MFAEHVLHGQPPQLLQPFSQLLLGPQVGDRDVSPVLYKEACHTRTTVMHSQTQHKRTLALQGERLAHESARATPTIEATIPTSQNRMAIWVSAQPIISKWLCKGAIRKRRLPRVSL